MRRASLDLADFSLRHASSIAASLRLAGCLINFLSLRRASRVNQSGCPADLLFEPASCVVHRSSREMAGQQIDFFNLHCALCLAALLILSGCLIDFLSLRCVSCVVCHCITYSGWLFD